MAFQTGSDLFARLADIATLVARYNVIESIFRQWPSMTIEKKYEQTIINFCMTVFQYLESIQHAGWSLFTTNPPRTSFSSITLQDLSEWEVKTTRADAACRGFTVILEPEAAPRDAVLDRVIEEVEDAEDTMDESADEVSVSHPTLGEHDSKECSQEDFRSAKRVKVCH